MGKITDKLFLSVSKILGTRMTPDTYRSVMADVNSFRGITRKDKTLIMTEMLAAIIEIEKGMDGK